MEITDTFRAIVGAEAIQATLRRSYRYYRQGFIQRAKSIGNEPTDQPAGFRHFPADRRILHHRTWRVARKGAGRAALLGLGAPGEDYWVITKRRSRISRTPFALHLNLIYELLCIYLRISI